MTGNNSLSTIERSTHIKENNYEQLARILTDDQLSERKNADNRFIDGRLPKDYCFVCHESFKGEKCQDCEKQMFPYGRSGNNDLDNIIQYSYWINRFNNYDNSQLEWAPYDQFSELSKIGEGGYGTVCTAVWKDGPKSKLNEKTNMYEREPGQKVALKIIKNSDDSCVIKYFREIVIHIRASNTIHSVTPPIYAISKDEQSNYVIIMEYFPDGSLRDYFKCEEFKKSNFMDKIPLLSSASLKLSLIHSRGYIHQDLHPGNILIKNEICYITDFGQSSLLGFDKSQDIIGVPKYMAPEVRREKKYSKEADVYAFGMIMYEAYEGVPPFHDEAPDCSLHVRPKFRPNPDFKDVLDLMQECWHEDPTERPTFEKISEKIQSVSQSAHEKFKPDLAAATLMPFGTLEEKEAAMDASYKLPKNYCIVCNEFSQDGKCQGCEKRMFPYERSGDNDLDNLIEFSDIYDHFDNSQLEWVPYDQFSELTEIKRGGYGTICTAVWKDGPKSKWNEKTNKYEREPGQKVVLKTYIEDLDNSCIIKYFREVIAHMRASNAIRGNVPAIYAISKNEQSNYVIIMEYFSDGSLHDYFKSEEYKTDTFSDKISILYSASLGLAQIHLRGYIHQDLCPKNILMKKKIDVIHTEHGKISVKIRTCYITDFGQGSFLKFDKYQDVIGKPVYMAPEIRKKEKEKKYSKEADVYAFGMIMYEAYEGVPPFHDKTLDYLGKNRPKFHPNPDFKDYLDLMQECWHEDPAERPTFEEISQRLLSISVSLQPELQPASHFSASTLLPFDSNGSIEDIIKGSSKLLESLRMNEYEADDDSKDSENPWLNAT